jgi:hypothetical protein
MPRIQGGGFDRCGGNQVEPRPRGGVRDRSREILQSSENRGSFLRRTAGSMPATKGLKPK